MRNHKAIPLFLLLLGSAVLFTCSQVLGEEDENRPVGKCTPAPQGEDWMALFEGEAATQWENVTDEKDGVFSIEDGVFTVAGQKPTRYIAYQGQPFGDFDFHIEYKVAPGANSGVFFRTDPKNPVQGGMEVQVYDSHGEAPSRQGGGALYDVATPMFNMCLPAGSWNSLDITCEGSKVVVLHNGWKVLDLDLAKMTMPIGKFTTPLAEFPLEGHLVLQNHGDDVWFRNALVRER